MNSSWSERRSLALASTRAASLARESLAVGSLARDTNLAIALLIVLSLLLFPVRGHAQQQFTLQDAIALAQKQGLQARAALRARDAARNRDDAFGANLLPQVSLVGTVPSYNRSIIPVTQPDGSTLFRAQQQDNAALTMNVTQTLPYLGGQLFFASALSRVQIAGEHSQRTWSGTPFQVGIRQNLLRSNSASWDGKSNAITADIAERQFLEAREDVAISTSGAFFDFFAAKLSLANAQQNSTGNDSLFTLNKGRFEVGKIGENDLQQSELSLLRARMSLDQAQLDYERTLSALRIQLNLPLGTPIEIVAPTQIPQFTPDTTIAVTQALRNSSSIRNLELQDVQARRRISEAKYNTGFGATLTASMGFNQSGPEANRVYQDLLEAQQFQLSVSMPILQWGARGAQIQAVRADLDRVTSTSQLAREQSIQEAHFAALQLSQSARQLVIAAKADTVAASRFEVAKNRYLIGKIGIDILVQAQNDKDSSLLGYVQALRGYWTAYYRLRRLTLYDFEKRESLTLGRDAR